MLVNVWSYETVLVYGILLGIVVFLLPLLTFIRETAWNSKHWLHAGRIAATELIGLLILLAFFGVFVFSNGLRLG